MIITSPLFRVIARTHFQKLIHEFAINDICIKLALIQTICFVPHLIYKIRIIDKILYSIH